MRKTEYLKNIAEIRRAARRAGWSLAKVDAAERCAGEWANATQNTSGEEWDWNAWRAETVSHFCSFTDGEFDGYWQECAGFTE